MPTRRITTRFPKALAAELEVRAATHGIPVSEVVRHLVKQALTGCADTAPMASGWLATEDADSAPLHPPATDADTPRWGAMLGLSG